MDSQATPSTVICEVCGTHFETRRGLSSHARLHLRQLGVAVSESSGAPIDLLYQLIQGTDGPHADIKLEPSLLKSKSLKKSSQKDSHASSPQEEKKKEVKSLTSPRKLNPLSSPVRPKEPTKSSLSLSPSALKRSEACSSSDHKTATKPQWAPSDTDAPISLAADTKDEVYVCEICGSWYETRQGLSAHARAHLRQIGISESNIEGCPITFLYRIMEADGLDCSKPPEERNSQSSPLSSGKRPPEVSSPSQSSPSKKLKTFSDSTCVLCGEIFENRKGLASHSRSHLRHFGVSDLVGKSSAIDAIQELIDSGMVEPVNSKKTNSATSSSAGPSSAQTSTALSPSLSRSWSSLSDKSFSSGILKSIEFPQGFATKAPKAKKGFRLAVDPLHKKTKLEPVETEVFDQPKESNSVNNSPLKLPTCNASTEPIDSDLQSPPTVLCDFCGQLFETRKALSCHVRAHLRQLGVTWSIRTSPIDLLKEVMLRGDERKGFPRGGSLGSGKTIPNPKKSRQSFPPEEDATNSCASPVDYSMKGKPSSGKTGPAQVDTSCELCGFVFENRKALASHARAHLRQLGVFEWRADGASSPIELLSNLIRKDPSMVKELTRRYRFGDVCIKKRAGTSPSMSTDSETVLNQSPKSSLPKPEHRANRKDHSSIHARTQRGVHTPKHGVSSLEGNPNNNPHQPSRSGNIPALLPKPPLTPLVKVVGKICSLKCRFCEEVFHGPLSVQQQWITHLQEHILSLGYKGKAAPPAAPVTSPTLAHPVAV